MEEEVWLPVGSRPELLASSWGRIMRRPHEVLMPKGGVRVFSSKPTYGVVRWAKKGAVHEYRGYRYRGIGNVKVHRVVCEAFHGPAPFPKAVVLHVDENAHNNAPINVRWGTQKENLNMPLATAVRLAQRRAKAGLRREFFA